MIVDESIQGRGPMVHCTNCGDDIYSSHRHDYVMCKCMQEYRAEAAKVHQWMINRGWNDRHIHTLMCIHHDKYCKGVAVDGGADYVKISR